MTANAAVLLPAATVTEEGTVAELLLLDRVTAAPPVGAAAVKVTVPVTDVPPVTLVGLTVTELKAAVATAVTAREAVWVPLP